MLQICVKLGRSWLICVYWAFETPLYDSMLLRCPFSTSRQAASQPGSHQIASDVTVVQNRKGHCPQVGQKANCHPVSGLKSDLLSPESTQNISPRGSPVRFLSSSSICRPLKVCPSSAMMPCRPHDDASHVQMSMPQAGLEATYLSASHAGVYQKVSKHIKAFSTSST